jgi:signal transduction histidine kinase/DNA-binding response OmpR family regulator
MASTQMLRLCAGALIAFGVAAAFGDTAAADDQIGRPLIHNYNRPEVGAEVQHWDAIQDERGIVYFANNAGVVEYDGRTWRLIELPSRLGVLSLAIDPAGKGPIYVGARGDFGYLGPDAAGQLQFRSLLPPEAREDPGFDQIFRPVMAPAGGVYFQARNRLCRWFGERLQCRESNAALSKIFAAGGRLYVQQHGAGLMQLVEGFLQPVSGGERFAGDEISVVLSYLDGEEERLLVGSRAFGLYFQHERSFQPFARVRDAAREDQLLDGAGLPDGSFAFGTLLRGLLIVDREGNLVQQIDKSAGLQDNHVHAVLPDRQGGVWLGLQNGVSRVEVSSPFSIFDQRSGLEREWREVIRHGDTLYVRGYRGLFAANLPSLHFGKVREIEAPVWSFVTADNRLLVSSQDGIHDMRGMQARRIITYASTPMTMYRSRSDPRRVYVGLARGVASLRLTDGSWRDEGSIDGIDETITSIGESDNGSLWLVSQRQRVIRVTFAGPPGDELRPPNQRERRVRAYPLGGDALTGRISIREIRGRAVFLTESSIFEFDEGSERFVPASSLAALAGAGRRAFTGIAEDARGNIWVVSRNPGVVDFLRKQPDGRHVVDNAGLRRTLAWSVYPEPHGSVVWFCTPDYLLRYDPSIDTHAAKEFPTLIRKVTTNDDALVYGGAPIPEAAPVFSSGAISLHFEFAAPRFEDEQQNEFQSYLEGFDKDWSGWSTESSRTYTNLPAGDYRFHVRARDARRQIGRDAELRFAILPPWYQTRTAYACYLVLLCGFLLVVSKFERKRAHLKLQRDVEHLELEKLREVDQLKSRFFADISHEFRTPLTLILGPVGQMLEEVTRPETVQRLRLVRRNAQYLLGLISQLLDLSKLESGKMRLRASAGDLVPRLRSCVMAFAAVAERDAITLRFDAPSGPLTRDGAPIYFDDHVIEKIINNLLGNAFKFTPAGGVVAVEIRSGANSFEIVISDNGIGIPRHHLPHVFDRFYQVDGARSREGIGIGLALVKELVELHHGQIHVESGEGKGTKFIVRLPAGKDQLNPDEIVAVSPSTPREAMAGALPGADLECFREPVSVTEPSEESDDHTLVLIVEDHTDVRNLLREHLQPLYRVIEARDGSEGFEQAVTSLPDLVLSDVMMPRMNGFELCRALKNDERTCHIPVVLLTARAGLDDRLTGLDTGADGYLIKPFDRSEVLAQVKTLIEQRRRLRESFRGPVVLKPSEVGVAPMNEVFLKRVLTAVQNNVSDPDFDVERLGKEVGLSRSQLHRKLRALTNQSPTLMIRAIRLERATELLRQRTGSVAEIAYMVGFSSQAYFAKCFREQFGCSPKEYALGADASPASRARFPRLAWRAHRRG